ncbi:MAG: glycosyltransferase family 4 protein [Chloroflexales bacterium]|nr:glycosyltransferase family 4 protein [Chloroflexales bacterium]
MLNESKPLRIAFLDSWHQQVMDGSGTAAAIGGLGQALIQRGHSVTRIAPTFTWPQSMPLRRLCFNLQLPALLRNLSYDLVVGFDIDGVFYAGWSRNTPYTCSIKGVIAEEMRYESGVVRRLLWTLSRLECINARRSPLVLTTSDYCRRVINQHYGVPIRRIRIVPEGIDLAGWQGALVRSTYERESLTILCVARQYPRKRIADLLLAFQQVHRQIPSARLVIVGDGPEHSALRTLTQRLRLTSAVYFTGALPDDNAVIDWYRRSTVFCLPSIQEGFGIVFLEAMASGLPIVSTTAAAIPEVVPQRQAGILVPPANPDTLAEALLELLAQPDLCAAYGAFGQDYVRRFDWDRVAGRFLEATVDI